MRLDYSGTIYFGIFQPYFSLMTFQPVFNCRAERTSALRVLALEEKMLILLFRTRSLTGRIAEFLEVQNLWEATVLTVVADIVRAVDVVHYIKLALYKQCGHSNSDYQSLENKTLRSVCLENIFFHDVMALFQSR